MRNWKTKLFGDNRMNFYGWLCAGGLGVIASIGCVVLAAKFAETRYGVFFLLLGIWLPVLGLFCLSFQNYSARLAKSLEDEARRKDDD